MARQFFGGNPQGSSTGPSFAMSHHLPLPEMARMPEMNGSIGPDVDEVWAREHQFHHLGDSKVQAAWGAEFGSGPPQSLSGPSMPQEMTAHGDCEQSFQSYDSHSFTPILYRSTNAFSCVCYRDVRLYANGNVWNESEFQHVPSELRYNA